MGLDDEVLHRPAWGFVEYSLLIIDITIVVVFFGFLYYKLKSKLKQVESYQRNKFQDFSDE